MLRCSILPSASQLFSVNLMDFSTILKPSGCIYLPFQNHCLNMVVKHIDLLKTKYSITFLKRWELEEVALWKSTQEIDAEVMENVFRKKLDQEDYWCTITIGKTDATLSEASYSVLNGLKEDIASIRFMRLELLPAAEEPFGSKVRAYCKG